MCIQLAKRRRRTKVNVSGSVWLDRTGRHFDERRFLVYRVGLRNAGWTFEKRAIDASSTRPSLGAPSLHPPPSSVGSTPSPASSSRVLCSSRASSCQVCQEYVPRRCQVALWARGSHSRGADAVQERDGEQREVVRGRACSRCGSTRRGRCLHETRRALDGSRGARPRLAARCVQNAFSRRAPLHASVPRVCDILGLTRLPQI